MFTELHNVENANAAYRDDTRFAYIGFIVSPVPYRSIYRARCFNQRGRMIPIAMANRNQILRIMCHILAAWRVDKAQPLASNR
jgi:hypothetical protein